MPDTRTVVAITDASSTLAASYLGDADALNLLLAFAVERLLDNGPRIAMTGNDDVLPVVKLCTSDPGCTELRVSLW